MTTQSKWVPEQPTSSLRRHKAPPVVGKGIHFIAGVPRSGSTLLCNILAQNPRFQVTATSGILDAILMIRKMWGDIAEFKGLGNTAAKVNVMRAMLQGYFADAPRPVVFDKSRSWLAHLELAQTLLGREPKVLVPIRDVREILGSFEKIWRRSRASGPTVHEKNFYKEFQSVEGRCDVLMREDQVVGIAYRRIGDALLRGFGRQMHFVSFEQLSAHPARTLAGIYEFLEEVPFPHDFDHVQQVTTEDDEVYNLKGLHEIRPKVEPVAVQAKKILGPVADKYEGPYVWETFLGRPKVRVRP